MVDVYNQVRTIFIKPSKQSVPIDETDSEELDTDMPLLEVEECTEQQGQGLKLLTPEQMLSRSIISLAQLKAGNNSQKRKNEIRQLFYSLYRSKKLSKTIYKHLMNAI